MNEWFPWPSTDLDPNQHDAHMTDFTARMSDDVFFSFITIDWDEVNARLGLL